MDLRKLNVIIYWLNFKHSPYTYSIRRPFAYKYLHLIINSRWQMASNFKHNKNSKWNAHTFHDSQLFLSTFDRMPDGSNKLFTWNQSWIQDLTKKMDFSCFSRQFLLFFVIHKSYKLNKAMRSTNNESAW